MGLSEQLRRVTDLFVEGTEVVVQEEPPVLVWVNKLNAFEIEEARRDGAAARARMLLALRDIGTDESTVFEARVVEMDENALVEAIVAAAAGEILVKVVGAIESDPEWAERMEIQRRARIADDPAEQLVVEQIDREFAEEYAKRSTELEEQKRADMRLLDKTGLSEKYREVWREQQANSSFHREFQRTQLYFATRVCAATVKDSATTSRRGTTRRATTGSARSTSASRSSSCRTGCSRCSPTRSSA